MISLQHTSGRFGACNASVPKTSLYAHRHQFSGQNLGPQFCRGLLVQKSWRIHAEKPKGVKVPYSKFLFKGKTPTMHRYFCLRGI